METTPAGQRILKHLAVAPRAPQAAWQIANALGLNRYLVHSLLGVLEQEKYIASYWKPRAYESPKECLYRITERGLALIGEPQ